ncbi:hypothetical protein [Chitinophaga flava]|uniref:Uncharacterized protein n=1 Tax=Chitinophaga flava TaxID=2259036 RepID=A0A365XRY2_9BACT|nr:hypothetical protein [Chitinophaga flava]RBL89083.1 hypothetical protein DF182_21330 [Chitinophaga flava]
MGGYIYFYGVNQEQFLAKASDKFAAIKKKYQGQSLHLTARELKEIYYAEMREVAAEPESGLTRLLFSRAYHYLLEMIGYFLSGFDWQNDEHVDKYESYADGDYVFSKSQLLDITEWYVALSATANQEEGVDIRYQKPAAYIVNDYYEPKCSDSFRDGKLEFYQSMQCILEGLRDKVRNSSFDYFFITSFF